MNSKFQQVLILLDRTNVSSRILWIKVASLNKSIAELAKNRTKEIEENTKIKLIQLSLCTICSELYILSQCRFYNIIDSSGHLGYQSLCHYCYSMLKKCNWCDEYCLKLVFGIRYANGYGSFGYYCSNEYQCDYRKQQTDKWISKGISKW